MSNFIPRIIPSAKSAGLLPVGSLVWYFGKTTDVGKGELADWRIANGFTSKLSLYPELSGKFIERYTGDFYCGFAVEANYYMVNPQKIKAADRNTSKQYISTSSNYGSSSLSNLYGCEVLGTGEKTVYETIATASTSTVIDNVLSNGQMYAKMTNSKKTAYLFSYNGSEWIKTSIEYLKSYSATVDGLQGTIYADVDRSTFRAHKYSEHGSSINSFDDIQSAWSRLNNKSNTNTLKKFVIENLHLYGRSGANVDLLSDVDSDGSIALNAYKDNGESGISENNTVVGYITDMNNSIVTLYKNKKNNGDTSAYDKFDIVFPDITQGSTVVAADDKATLCGSNTNGSVPEISGSFYSVHNSNGVTNTSGAFSASASRLFGASGHNSVSIWGTSCSFKASDASAVYKPGEMKVSPSGVYAIPIVKIE